ncbi:hypothetical protein GGR57DRAFT_519144 [Xylariaceae sp. FL1272]|nr:hypothetical protein GGR57DRAFT_519144 [Xylariaceae sp. FL1272]
MADSHILEAEQVGLLPNNLIADGVHMRTRIQGALNRPSLFRLISSSSAHETLNKLIMNFTLLICPLLLVVLLWLRSALGCLDGWLNLVFTLGVTRQERFLRELFLDFVWAILCVYVLGTLLAPSGVFLGRPADL